MEDTDFLDGVLIIIKDFTQAIESENNDKLIKKINWYRVQKLLREAEKRFTRELAKRRERDGDFFYIHRVSNEI